MIYLRYVNEMIYQHERLDGAIARAARRLLGGRPVRHRLLLLLLSARRRRVAMTGRLRLDSRHARDGRLARRRIGRLAVDVHPSDA